MTLPSQPGAALLVIDVQQQLCDGLPAAANGDTLIERINQASHAARQAHIPVLFVQHEANSLPAGSAGWQLTHGLHATPEDHRVAKTTPDSFWKTDLQSCLDQLDVRELVVCGMFTEFCVDTTVRAALRLGYPITLLSDAHTNAGNAALSPQQVIAHHNATLSNIGSFGPRVTLRTSTEWSSLLASGT